MNNKYLLASVMGVLTVVLTYWFLSKGDQGKARKFDISFEKAGVPDQVESQDQAEAENADMVAEGSQFGVQYFNHLPDSKKKEIKDEMQNK